MQEVPNILAIDNGGGTQDILYYKDEYTPENCTSMVLPTPTKYYAQLIQRCTQDLFIKGDAIGGGVLPALLKKHLMKGHRVIMTEEAAFTLRNNLLEVQQMGIEILPDTGVDFTGTTITFQEVNLQALRSFLADCGETLAPQVVAVAVQDHGVPFEGMSNREFRFEMIRKRLEHEDQLEGFMFNANEIPSCFRRMRSVARAVQRQIECEVLVMDTAFAAILGCWEEARGNIFVNLGNNHTVAAFIDEGRITALLEHHTSCLDKRELETLLMRFGRGEVTSSEIQDAGGHGAFVSKDFSAIKGEEIIVTGPQRGRLKDSCLKVRFVAPYGNMMLTGPFGLVKGVLRKLGVRRGIPSV